MNLACIGVGSNAEPVRHIVRGLRALATIAPGLTCSQAWRSTDVNDPAAPPYVNLAVLFETTLARTALRRQLKDIEADCGRERHNADGAVTLDLDLLILRTAEAAERDPGLANAPDHVLAPLAELLPDWVPVAGAETFATLWAARADATQLEAVKLPRHDACADRQVHSA